MSPDMNTTEQLFIFLVIMEIGMQNIYVKLIGINCNNEYNFV